MALGAASTAMHARFVRAGDRAWRVLELVRKTAQEWGEEDAIPTCELAADGSAVFRVPLAIRDLMMPREWMKVLQLVGLRCTVVAKGECVEIIAGDYLGREED